MRGWPVLAVALVALGSTLSGSVADRYAPRRAANWREIGWPFLRDGWPAGRAFRCDACGAVELYVRPKIGFCNCDSGVADDEEVDRVADLDLLSQRFTPLKPGDAVQIAEMRGRIRAYDLKMADGSAHAAIGIAVAHRCDLLVAVAHGGEDAAELRRVALALLGDNEMARWMVVAMAGR